MKKLVFTALLFALSFTGSANAQNSSDSINITVHIAGLSDGTQVEIVQGATHKDEKKIATATIKNGNAQLSIPTIGARLYYLLITDTYGGLDFMADKGDQINISAIATSTHSQDGKSIYSFSKVRVEGSKTHQEYLQKYSARKKVEAWYENNIDKYKEVSDLIGKARAAKDTVLMKEIQASPEYKALNDMETKFYHKMEHVCDSTIMANKDSWWGPFLMLRMMTYFTPEQLNTYKSFSAEAQNSYYGKLVYDELSPAVEIGQEVPMFSLTKTDGSKVNGLSYLKGKKYILLDFWASWCGPCRKEIPNLKKLYELYKDKGFEIISVSIDRKVPDWEKALKEEQLQWPNFRDVDHSVADQFKIKAIPQIYLIDGQGKLVADQLRGEALANQLAELFK
ncbi:MAG: AhpC/TSA family protein [Bacteroides sp.]|jgi:thiol-disulfide isomerase/thioredoxin|nr:AhpC/TSA family protein [Bacteroides sp.]MCI1681151.1 AhpC/TSA family protein [Bacteroides sp.]